MTAHTAQDNAGLLHYVQATNIHVRLAHAIRAGQSALSSAAQIRATSAAWPVTRWLQRCASRSACSSVDYNQAVKGARAASRIDPFEEP